MLVRSLIAALIVAATTGLTASDGAAVSIPDILAKNDGTTIWVAAERAVDEKGELRSDALGQHTAFLRRGAETNSRRVAESAERGVRANSAAPDECQIFLGSVPQHFKPTGSLSEMVTNADVIVSGRIRAMRQGFLYGLPGALLEISPTYLKGAPSGGSTFLFYPVARIKTASGTICAKPVGPYVEPAVGDAVLVFSMVEPAVADGHTVLHVKTSRELVHAPHRGDPLIPEALTPAATGSNPFDSLLSQVKVAAIQCANVQ